MSLTRVQFVALLPCTAVMRCCLYAGYDKTVQRSNLCCVSTSDLLSLLLSSGFFPAHPRTNTRVMFKDEREEKVMIFHHQGILC